MVEPVSETSAHFPIRTVSNLTGVNSVTLRAWERRYQLITPRRTPKGHRLYSQQDIDKIHRILKLLDKGISIGQVKPMLDRPLALGGGDVTETPVNEWDNFHQQFLEAIYRFDELQLDEIYNNALSLYPQSMVISQLITPLLKTLGRQWNERDAGIAEEHFFSVYLRNKIGARLQHISKQNTGPRLLVTCLPDEYHEIGMLLFCLAVMSFGYRVTSLGSNLPLRQIPMVIKASPFDALVLSATTRISKKVIENEIPELVNELNIPVFIGGAASIKQKSALEDSGMILIGDELTDAIDRISESLKKA